MTLVLFEHGRLARPVGDRGITVRTTATDGWAPTPTALNPA
ncbi:hypothetical protein [Streptomyces hawaiiensis]